MAEVYALDRATVVKLDRPEFDGVAVHEARMLAELVDAGLPVPAVHDVVVIDGRHGIVLERLDGPLLADVITGHADVSELGALAEAFVELHLGVHAASIPSAPDLVGRLRSEIQRSGLPDDTTADVLERLASARSPSGSCHFDLHPGNIVVTSSGWRIIDWLTAATGPTVADFARTLVLTSGARHPSTRQFMEHVRAIGGQRRGLDGDELGSWIRIVAAARLAEGIGGAETGRLRSIAMGDVAATRPAGGA
jgi:Ser/Thr protein kinase RdoA (MazF antagonist)